MKHTLSYVIDLNGDAFHKGMDKAHDKTLRLDQAIRSVSGALAVGFSLGEMVSYGNRVVDVSSKVDGMSNAITFASGSQQEGAKNLKYLDDLTNKHGSNLMAATAGYKSFLGAMQGAPFTMSKINTMFRQVDVANKTMNLSAEESQGIYLALGQIMGKGKVSAEELRGQIGERLPGAFAIAARAMGKSQQELNKMMEDGELMATDFLPRFAAELEKTFGSGLERATQSFEAKANRRENAILKEEVAIGKSLQPAYLSLLDAKLGVTKAGGELLSFYIEHKKAIEGVAIGVAAASAIYYGFRTALSLGAAAQAYFNVVANASPLGVILGTVGLAAGAYYFFTGKTQKLNHEQSKLIATLHKSQTEFNLQIETLKLGNYTQEERKSLIAEINSKYGEYLPNLLKEEESLKGIEKAASMANKAFEDKIFLQATEDQLEPLIKRLSEIKKLGYDSRIGQNMAQAGANILSKELGNVPVGGFFINENNLIAPAAKGEVLNLEKQIEDIKKAAAEVRQRLGLGTGNNRFNASLNTTQSVSSSRSVRNVTVNIDSLVKEMINHFGNSKDINTETNFKRDMTQALIGIVRDSEIALG